MTDKAELEIMRGRDAEQLLANPLLQEAFAVIEADLIDKWQRSPVRDTEGRETLYLSQVLLQRLQAQLVLVVETGTVAKATLAQRAAKAIRELRT